MSTHVYELTGNAFFQELRLGLDFFMMLMGARKGVLAYNNAIKVFGRIFYRASQLRFRLSLPLLSLCLQIAETKGTLPLPPRWDLALCCASILSSLGLHADSPGRKRRVKKGWIPPPLYRRF